MPDLIAPLQYAFIQRAFVGATLIAVACACVGIFVVLRGLAFLGDAVAHIAFPGVVVAFLLKLDLVVGGSIAAVAGALSIGYLARRAGLREDTAIGIVFSGMFALGIVLFARIRTFTGDLLAILFGDVLAIGVEQLILASVVVLVVVAVLWLLWRELVFASFDPIGARAAGLSVTMMDVVLLTLIGVTIAVSIQVVGVILVVALLVTPAATARLVSQDLRQMLALSLVISATSAVGGIYGSFYLNTASGGTIVLVATAIFVLTSLARALLASRARRS